ncbi:16S rRNA (guanine(527)-N(7))-methyltransferase RsmG [Peptococcus simiae]|uniref:Ribosomal RNA small subunit methyltransferase G n=1 Tax=Peptococcus simiae TaxID=1643805 RepID=A0ABW9GZD4_9FIRM
MTAKDILEAFARAGLDLDLTQADQFLAYDARLRAANQEVNLTAITAPEAVLEKHFIDCALVLPHLPAGPQRVIDIGSGAGFPGMVWAILRPDWTFTLLDSLQKRVHFLEGLALDLGLADRVQPLHGRAEDLAHQADHRAAYDLASGRAVTGMGGFLEYALPFVKTGGLVAVMKGPGEEGSLAAIRAAAETLGGAYRDQLTYALPAGDSRRLWRFDKLAASPDRYPRRPKAMKNKPLI